MSQYSSSCLTLINERPACREGGIAMLVRLMQRLLRMLQASTTCRTSTSTVPSMSGRSRTRLVSGYSLPALPKH